MRVLLVDDHMDGLEITARLLRLEGFEVATAGMCHDAMNLARDQQFDIVVTDLGLPDGTGMDLLERLNQIRRIPGIAITAHGERMFIEGASRGGFVRHLFKPFVFSDLLAAVREVLEQPERSAAAAPPPKPPPQPEQASPTSRPTA